MSAAAAKRLAKWNASTDEYTDDTQADIAAVLEERERLREALQEIESLSEPGSIVCEIIRAARSPRKAQRVKR